jgi:biotin carboxylase
VIKLVILGAGVYQVPLIEKSKELGHHTIVVSPTGNYPGIGIADEHWALDTRDVSSILEKAIEAKISGITTTGTDVAVPAIGAVNDALGLSGPCFDTSEKCMNKALMKAVLSNSNIATAKYQAVSSFEEALFAVNNIGYPVMVKATDSSGSRGITKVNSEAELAGAWASAKSVTQDIYVIIEEYLDGIEFGGQAIIFEQSLVDFIPHNDTVTSPPYCVPYGHSVPINLPDDVIQNTKDLICDTITALGLNNCIANVDFMLVGNKPYIIEIGARMGATGLAENVSLYTGKDAYESVIELCLGKYTPSKNHNSQPNAALLLRSDRSGKVSSINIPQEVLEHPNLKSLVIDVVVGDEVNDFKVGPDRIGHVVTLGNTVSEAENLARKLSQLINIEIS